ncbi:MAG: DUF1489 domain-containing protein [Hyphomicrobium sp.]|jgi:hypothetical protein|nr:DUF1489 domain-containing protein [Hyphomicrobium sp.]
MTLHLIKLSVGSDSVEDHARWQAANRQFWRKVSGKPAVFHTTFQTPKRTADLLDGGSLYWVVKGMIQARQRLVGFDEGKKEDGKPCCLLLLDPVIVPVRPVPRRAFQGWRYLEPSDAPPDLTSESRGNLADLPPAMRRELAALGLL